MDAFVLKEGKNTPEITFDPAKDIFSVTGRSFPENAKKYYEPVLTWLDNFNPQSKGEISVDFSLYYISSSSIISMLELIRKFDKLNSDSCQVTINWYYDSDDEDLLKIGEDYQKICTVEFNLIENK